MLVRHPLFRLCRNLHLFLSPAKNPTFQDIQIP